MDTCERNRNRYAISVVTAAADDVLSIETAKRRCRIDHDEEDQDVEGWVKDATRYLQSQTARQFVTATLRQSMDEFPEADRSNPHGAIELMIAPVQSVTSVKYIDTAGVERTLATSDYIVDLYSEPARISPAYGTSWPSARYQPNAINVVFVAGYGDQDDVPPDAATAVQLLVGSRNENREAVSVEKLNEIPHGAKILINSLSWGIRP